MISGDYTFSEQHLRVDLQRNYNIWMQNLQTKLKEYFGGLLTPQTGGLLCHQRLSSQQRASFNVPASVTTSLIERAIATAFSDCDAQRFVDGVRDLTTVAADRVMYWWDPEQRNPQFTRLFDDKEITFRLQQDLFVRPMRRLAAPETWLLPGEVAESTAELAAWRARVNRAF